jgi:hypothetical protein
MLKWEIARRGLLKDRVKVSGDGDEQWPLFSFLRCRAIPQTNTKQISPIVCQPESEFEESSVCAPSSLPLQRRINHPEKKTISDLHGSTVVAKRTEGFLIVGTIADGLTIAIWND